VPCGAEVSLGPGYTVLDGDPAPLFPKRGTAAPNFGPCLLWPNGSIDQDATWYRCRPQPRPHCVRWGPSSRRKGHSSLPILADVYCGQTAGWIRIPHGTEVGLGPGDVVLECSRFRPIRFTFGVIPERVNTIKTGRKVFPIFD